MPQRPDPSDDDSLLRAIARAPEMAPPDAAQLVGRIVGRFKVLRKIGAGGMGVVYEAEDARLGRHVALKVLPRADDAEVSARFVREARSASLVAHPNVAVIYEAGEDGDVSYIAMELVEGETLGAWLDADRSLRERGRVACEIAAALAKAHSLGIVHRDLKPSNVMIARDGTAKVLDFGLAKRQGGALATDEASMASGEGRLVGTPGYMSPEQVKGKDVDVRSDVFAFGVLAYEMFTGRRAFHGDTPTELLIAIDRDEPPSMRKIAPRLPEELVAVVEKCLRKSPDERWADAGELLRALERVRGRALAQQRASTRRRLAIAAGVILATAAELCGLLYWAGGRRTQAATAAAASASPAAPTAAPTAVTELPPPKSNNAEALSAYATAMQGLRDGSLSVEIRNLQRALKLDPDFAAAHLRLLARFANLDQSRDEQRRDLTAASGQRALLSERDRDVLGMFEPIVVPDVPQWDEALRRAQRAVERWSGDADLAVLHGDFLFVAGHVPEALAEYDRALALDPSFALPLHQRAMVQAGTLDDPAGALDSATRCLTLSPTAASCERRRADAHRALGQCEELEADARRNIGVDPDGYWGYQYLADALSARGAPLDSVAEAFRQVETLDPNPQSREREKLHAAAALAVRVGDFATAEARLLDLLRTNTDPSESAHPGARLIRLYEETGETAKAVRVAEDFMNRFAAMTSDAPGSVRPYVLSTLRAAGKLGESEWRAKRDAWVAEAVAKSWPANATVPWFDFYARTARTPEDAREALEAMPRFVPMHVTAEAVGNSPVLHEAMGRVYLLAGRLDEAIEHLRRVTAECDVITHTAERTFAQEELGEALAAKGDTQAACAPLQRVIDRWGHAKPRSKTAERALLLARKIGCAPGK